MQTTSISSIDIDKPLGTIVTETPSATQILLRHRLDFCCGGHRSLAEACADLQLDPHVIAQEIAAREADQVLVTGWDQRPLTELVGHIVDVYHAHLRTSLPALLRAAQKVERVHRDKPDCPHGLASHLEHVSEAVEAHLETEERVLFPAILGKDPSDTAIAALVAALTDEHDDHGANLARTRELAHDLVPPPEACGTWRALYEGLTELEASLMEHVHLENHVLFPRAIA